LLSLLAILELIKFCTNAQSKLYKLTNDTDRLNRLDDRRLSNLSFG